MYSRCLFCAGGLGRNAAVEAFPVGRRLADDAAKGRLWVVCPSCARWNLTPLEERWEAIEQAERLFRGTRLRVSTDHVGLARVADGTDLVRVGAPLRPEFAAWRYGAVLRRRERRYFVRAAPAAGVAVAGAGVYVSGWVFLHGGGAAALAGPGASLAGGVAASVAGMWVVGKVSDAVFAVAGRVGRAFLGSPVSVAARVRAGPGDPIVVRRGHLAESTLRLAPGRDLGVSLRHDGGIAELAGDDARRALAAVAPALNGSGADASTVRDAVAAIDVRGGSDAYLRTITAWVERATRTAYGTPSRWTPESQIPDAGLYGLRSPQRLALEIALHEEQERRAMDGELAALAQAWRDAESIAAIADDLVVPGYVRRAMDRLRGRA